MEERTLIITDSSSGLKDADFKDTGIRVVPFVISLDDEAFIDNVDITSLEVIEGIKQGKHAISSQPRPQTIIEMFEENINKYKELVFLTIPKHLSGSYQSGIIAAREVDEKRIFVFDSSSTCGVQKYMAETLTRFSHLPAVKLEEILNYMRTHTCSYVFPTDIKYLKKSGRLSSSAALIASVLKVKPILKFKGGSTSKIEKFTVVRTLTKAIESVVADMKKEKVTERDYRFFVSHSTTENHLQDFMRKIKEFFPKGEFQVDILSPLLAAHGGPDCIVFQYVKKYKE